MGHSRPLFLYFRLFYAVDGIKVTKFTNDWIRTADLWCREQLYKGSLNRSLSHKKVFRVEQQLLCLKLMCSDWLKLQGAVFVCFSKIGQSRPLFAYFRPLLITISIIQVEKA